MNARQEKLLVAYSFSRAFMLGAAAEIAGRPSFDMARIVAQLEAALEEIPIDGGEELMACGHDVFYRSDYDGHCLHPTCKAKEELA